MNLVQTNRVFFLSEHTEEKHNWWRGWDAANVSWKIAIRFLFPSNVFLFDGNLYIQILGSPMDSNFSPSITELVMDFLLDRILAHFPFNAPFIKKYVDDIIIAVPRDQINSVLETFNREYQTIQFSLEEETDNSVPFLDTRVIRTADNKLMVDRYRKPSNSGR